MDESRTRHVPWYVHAFAACVAAIGISLGIVFGFGIKSAFAFTVDGTTYPDTLAGVTVTFNDTLYEPTYGPGWEPQTYYSLHLVATGVSGNASAYVSSEGHANVSGSSHPWYFWANGNQSTTKYGNSQFYFYDGTVNAWGGLQAGVTAPTVTFYDVSGDTLLTNSLFIMWVVGNSDYDERYGNESFTSYHASASNGIVAFSYVSSVVSPIVRLYSSQNQETWSLVSSQTPGAGTQAGTFTVSTPAYYRVDFVYTLSGQTHTENVYVGYVAPPNVSLPVFTSYVFTPGASFPSGNDSGTAMLTLKYSTTGAKPDSLTLYISTNNGQDWRQVGYTNKIHEESGTYNGYFYLETSGLYKVIAQVSGGQTETELGNFGVDAGDNEWENIWDEGMQNLNPIFQTFRDLWTTLFSWIPAELRGFLLSLMLVMIVLGIVSRVI